jgi:Ca-activated chloride channel family protein
VGTPAGGPIPIYDEKGNRQGFKKNNKGQVVTSTLNEFTLNEIARVTGGIYLRVENQVNAIVPLLTEIDQMEKRELKSHVFSQYEDRYQVFLIMGLLLLIAEFVIPTRTKKEMVWEGRFTRSG